MAHFAIINDENVVLNVVVVANEAITDENGLESEQMGKTFLSELLDIEESKIIQTSYNNNIRDIFASIGYYYDPAQDIFLYPYDMETGDYLSFEEAVEYNNMHIKDS